MGTVGALVPNSYSSFLRIHCTALRFPATGGPPTVMCTQSWPRSAHRHTSTVDRAWFAVWEGHGFDTAETRLAWPDPAADDAERQRT